MSQELILLCSTIIILYLRPAPLVSFANTVLGKISLIAMVVILTSQSTTLGFLAVVLTLGLLDNITEGFDTETDSESDSDKPKDKKTDPKKDFREKNCKKNILIDSDGNEVKLDDINKQFPNLKFDGDDCNPCDAGCNFSITSDDQLSNEEKLRPVEANTLPISSPSDDPDQEPEPNIHDSM